VGWQGSREAARALAAAVPLLGMAESIHIVTITEGKEQAVPPEAARTYLAWHGLKSHVTVCEPKGSVAATLFHKAHVEHAGLLVMGAYSHTRFRELVFGGVTEHALTRAEIPTLVCH
jgi:nucleotide-binding universal stress UspA family protein